MDTKQAELELSVIKKIMEDSRRVVSDNGWHYIFWGVIVTIALIANYIMALSHVDMKFAGIMWFVMMVSAAIVEGVIERRNEKKRKAMTFAAKLLGSLWTSSGIAMFMIGFIGTISGAYNPVYISPLISIVLGVAYFTSGAIQQIKWLQMLSVGWWLGAIGTFAFPGIHTLLIFAAMIVCFQIIPGVILFKKWKKEKAPKHK
jgi:hypothetical protein